MASMTRSESIAEPSSTPTITPKTLQVNGTGSTTTPALQKPVAAGTGPPARTSAPRVEIEPLYTALKSQIGEHWATYKEAISVFILGRLNQAELSRRIDWLIANDPSREHLHNQLVAAIYANTQRDPPEPGVASWVSANDKPSAASKPSSGDAAELRLKTEVKELPGRERKRLKAIPESDPVDYFARELQEYHEAKHITIPDTGPASAAGFSKTNWDLEIRKRYAQPLCTETFEFPDTSTIDARMTPICYEEGIASGAASECASFMNQATEIFIKEVLSNILGRVRSNGEDYIKTASYKKQLQREEELSLNNEVQRNAAGLLPVEVEESRRRKPISLGDLRVALELGDSYLGQVPLICAGILNARYDTDGYDEMEIDEPILLNQNQKLVPGPRLNGSIHGAGPSAGTGPAAAVGPALNGINGTAPVPNGVHHEDEIMSDDLGWQGTASKEREVVYSTLDDILTGQ
ncbi:transcriptional regulator of RNA polII, SAGA, subunit-domain-containing protein [Phyllosticta citribraziliensis]|uniref:Transcriptional regulator of RNA polII, SAGA, subunit-domain-containing protein n=1 Tax=Phyllosticta citribraziliensis TaxID=989973 RepID=A0ABR1LD03_9PEZI